MEQGRTALKTRLIVMNFLEFAVWGAYLTCMGNYLGRAGMGHLIAWFYSAQGIVSIFMPTLMGIVADRWIQPQRVLSLCHLVAGAAMVALCLYGMAEPTPDPTTFLSIYVVSIAFFMPTIALGNTVAFSTLKNNGMDTVRDFPPIRVFGTVGFIATMWFVNCAVWENGHFGFTLGASDAKFQDTYMQFLVSGVLSLVLALYCLTLPQCPLVRKQGQSLSQAFGLDAFRLFRNRRMAQFFIFSAMLGMALQVTNGFATPYLKHFQGVAGMEDSFGANNATLLVSLSQIAEAFCILLIPFFMKRFGIKVVMLIAMLAWVLRFGFFGAGDPELPGVLFIVLSCLVYGVAFDFFNVSGGLFVDQECDPSVRASGQGLFMLMTNGVGASIGTLAAGAVINHYCAYDSRGLLMELTPGGWSTCWYIFAAYSLAVAIAFALIFKDKQAQPATRGKATAGGKAGAALLLLLPLLALTACQGGTARGDAQNDSDSTAAATDSASLAAQAAPSRELTGTIGDGTSMNVLELVTDSLDTLYIETSRIVVSGGLLAGQRINVVYHKDPEGLLATAATNISALLHLWTRHDAQGHELSLELNPAGHAATYGVTAPPYNAWRLHGGLLLLSTPRRAGVEQSGYTDTFDIMQLDPDTLVLAGRHDVQRFWREN